jgi:putative transcriptional regulator
MSENSVYESLIVGLNEALADAQSEKPILKRNKVFVADISDKIVEAWKVL